MNFHDDQGDQAGRNENAAVVDLKTVIDDRTYRTFTVTREYVLDVALDEVAAMLVAGVNIDEDDEVLAWLKARNYVDECLVTEDCWWEHHITTPIPDGWLEVKP